MIRQQSSERVSLPVQRVRSTTGEPMVWLTAMGLTIGLAMVVYLIGLIIDQWSGSLLAHPCGTDRTPGREQGRHQQRPSVRGEDRQDPAKGHSRGRRHATRANGR